jgi:Domain of unknown function (DUF4136)
MARFLPIATLLLATIGPRAAAAQTVTYDYDRTANFNRLRSFALRDGKISDNPLLDRRIQAEIANGLSARGLSQTAMPDMFVAPSLTSETRKEISTYTDWYPPFGWYGSYLGYGSYGWYGPGWGGWTTSVRDREYATLTVDMIDADTGSLVWRGKGIRDVNPEWKADTIDAKVRKLVAKILRNFPPTSEGRVQSH